MSFISVNQLLKAIAVVREAEPAMTTAQLHVFLHIMQEPGLSATDLIERTGQNMSSMSRNIRGLSDWQEPTKPGLDLIVWETDRMNRRAKVAHLNQRGKELERLIKEALGQ